ncbi:amidase [Rhodococcus opacus]|uniref:amidase n=1 Tax=Rhodococcus opacus TaxID=37919 RepID=UPI0003120A0A|nr:amidase [Rhodococcus opacus]AHK34411.1 Glutamyl-tRNA(Gln) amidotransferase subunit A [Rhodococcus opacus PD630]UDG96569.1 amidase [Rhodococcus opacus PD630]
MDTSLSALTTSVTSDELRPSEVVADALERVDRTEPDIRAWVRVDRARALEAARRLDSTVRKSPLHGIPFGVKDIIDVRGLPTECGSPLRRGRVADDDAPLVARLRELGAIPLGKTVTTEFAYFAPGPTRNPNRLSHTPGGSSSGSAAAVAAGVVPLALGSQTAGSLTRPASYCGVAGLVAPVGGPLDTTGFAGLSHTLDAAGILTRSVTDVRLAYLALTGSDRLADPVRNLERPRLAAWSGIELVDISDDMQTAVRHTVEAAVAEGAELVDFDWPALTPRLVEAHGTVMAYEASRALASEGRHPTQLSAPLNDLLTQGRSITDRDYQDALAVAARARSAILTLLTDVDAIIGPAAPGAAPEGLSATGSPILSRPWQLLGLPALTVPGRLDGQGMPLGIQLIGHPSRVERLLALGSGIEETGRRGHEVTSAT